MYPVTRYRIITSVASLAICSASRSQSFNIDLDIAFGGPEVGAGAPSSSFGAAANQQGYWNIRGASLANRAEYLRTLDGELSPVTIDSTSSGGGRGSGWTINTGDHRLLLNDCTRISVPTTFTFSNLMPGTYKVFTYAVDNVGLVAVPMEVRVPGAFIERRFSGRGFMPGNQFVEDITHSIHTINLTTSTLQVVLRNPNSTDPPDPSLAGFQIVRQVVPEPSALLVLTFGAGVLIRFRRHKVVP